MEISQQQLSVAYRKAGANALNKVATNARTEAVRKIREKYSIKYGSALDRIRIIRATPQRLEAYIVVDDKAKNARIPLASFSARQNAKGVRVRLADDWQMDIKHGFIPQLPSGHRGVFIRRGEKRRMMRGKYSERSGDALTFYLRQPIVEMAGPKLGALYLKSGAPDAVKAAARKLYGWMANELKFQIGKATDK